jgi:hypothetical protein
MITETKLQNMEREYGSEDHCQLCGTNNGIHKFLTRENGITTICRGGDMRLLVQELRRVRTRMYIAVNNLTHALGEEKT